MWQSSGFRNISAAWPCLNGCLCHWNGVAGLEVLKFNSLSWSSPLPFSLRTLSISGSTLEGMAHLCATLPGLFALEFFSLKTQDNLQTELAGLLAALRCCPLTQLALESACLGVLCEK